MLKLLLPSTEYKESYIEAVIEFQAENNPNAVNYLDLKISDLETNFEAYVQKLHDQRAGKNLPEGFVPATEFWLVKGRKYLGRVHIRHTLTPYLLKIGGHIGYNIRKSERGKGYGTKALELGLIEAKKLGIEKVLVTCDTTNIPSLKVIEANGGVLENIEEVGGDLPAKRRYWIDQTNSQT